MNPGQIAALRERMGIAEGEEWEPWAGLGGNAAEAARGARREQPHRRAASASGHGTRSRCPPMPAPAGDEQSTQAAFGRILLDLSRAGGALADRIVTTSPDVTVSTNLGAWVNQRGLFRRQDARRRLRGGEDPVGAEMGRDRRPASISSSASPRTICS